MLRRLFLRLFRRSETGAARARPIDASPRRPPPPPVSDSSAPGPEAPAREASPPVPPPPPPPAPLRSPPDPVAGGGHSVRFVLEDGTVIDPPEDPELREKMAYLADNLLTSRTDEAQDS